MDLVSILDINWKGLLYEGLFLFALNKKIIIKKSDLYLYYKWLIAGYLMIFIERIFIMS